MVFFSLAATTMGDAAKSKPWMGFFGLFSACLATLAGFGFCSYVQVEWISLTLAAPFLLFGIRMDDTFVMLSAWRRSNSHMSVPERMGKAYAEAGISITFTSLTNIARYVPTYVFYLQIEKSKCSISSGLCDPYFGPTFPDKQQLRVPKPGI